MPPLFSTVHRFCQWSSQHRKRWRWLGLGAIAAIALIVISATATQAQTTSNYELAQAQAFNHVADYPIRSVPSSANFYPNGEWIGRLILPSEQDYAQMPGDWAWFEVWHGEVNTSVTNTPDLLGQTIRLAWTPTEETQRYVDTATHDVTFTPNARNSAASGNILPTRLDGRKQVGPLQSLAGARPQDDVTVRLVNAELVMDQGQPVLQTPLEPFVITGREYGLVTILEPDNTVNAPIPDECPGPSPWPTEYFRVQHYTSEAKDFNGPIETVRIPQQPMMRGDRVFSTIRELEKSPAGSAGWYIYGSRDQDNIFTVQALKPRALFQLQPDQVIVGERQGRHYLNHQNWRQEAQRKGTINRVLVSADPIGTDGIGADQVSQDSYHPEANPAGWEEGSLALVIHLFGGIGGQNKEPTPLSSVGGHFSYGLAIAKQEPIAQELQLEVLYQQIYAHNTDGILSGTHDWSAYAGDMQRGWIGMRPFSDVVVKLDAFIRPFTFDDKTLSVFSEMLTQAQVLMARYRIGDGTGMAMVTPATSCVQDSNQALFIAIEQIKQQLTDSPDITEWFRQHPDSPEVERVSRIAALGQDLETLLSPYGIVRPDWKTNAESLSGIEASDGFTHPTGLVDTVVKALLSWRTMMPRWGHDEVARIFLENGAQLWFLRSSMVGGNDPLVEPLAPTTLFGLIPGVGRMVQRLTDAAVVVPTGPMMGLGLVGVVLYGAIALPYGFKSGFLQRKGAIAAPLDMVLWNLRLFLIPSLLEEIIFRVFLLPHPIEGATVGRWWMWCAVSILAFVGYHIFVGKLLGKRRDVAFSDPRFLLLVAGLGLVLNIVYAVTGSLWVITGIHWLVVMGWIYRLGGHEKLADSSRDRSLAQNPPLDSAS